MGVAENKNTMALMSPIPVFRFLRVLFIVSYPAFRVEFKLMGFLVWDFLLLKVDRHENFETVCLCRHAPNTSEGLSRLI